MDSDKVIYFSVNNWFCGRDYPDTPNFRKWLGKDMDQYFADDEWCKKNKLCVYHGTWDMSFNYTVSASREWVEKNCPELLTDDEYTYVTQHGSYKKKGLFGKSELVWENVEHKKKYSDFVYTPEVEGDTPPPDRFDMPFREYKEENFGSEYFKTSYWDSDDEEEEEEEENEEE